MCLSLQICFSQLRPFPSTRSREARGRGSGAVYTDRCPAPRSQAAGDPTAATGAGRVPKAGDRGQKEEQLVLQLHCEHGTPLAPYLYGDSWLQLDR